jgi:hypothetical protein
MTSIETLRSEKRCVETVYPNDQYGSFHGHQCNKMGIIKRDGKWYCKIHDPEYIKEKHLKLRDKWDKQYKISQLNFEREQVINTLTNGYSTELLKSNTIKIRGFIEALKGSGL